MKVQLLSYTQHPEELVAIAASNCVSGSSIAEITKQCLDKSKVRSIINTIKKNHHYSVFEHVSFTFGIEGVSRVLLAQITRHRIASFSVRSMRYAAIDESLGSMLGSTIEEQRLMNYNNGTLFKEESLRIFHKAYEEAIKHYQELKSLGVSQENARYVLPNGTKTAIVLTMNARELMHFFGLRCCKHAQSEIRVLAKEMSELVTKVAPILFSDLNGASCEQLGYCPEGKRSCHRYPTLDELIGAYKDRRNNNATRDDG